MVTSSRNLWNILSTVFQKQIEFGGINYSKTIRLTYISGKITYKGLIGLISKNWEVKEGIAIQEKIDANLPEDSMQPIQQLRKTAHLFTNKQKLEKHGNNWYFLFLCRLFYQFLVFVVLCGVTCEKNNASNKRK